MSDAASPSTTPGAVHRAFGLLQSVVAADEPVGVRELARRTGLSKSTTGRLLATLEELGMVERTTDGRAFPGTGLATLSPGEGARAATMRDTLRPLLFDLVERYAESAGIGVDNGSEFFYVSNADGPGAVQVPNYEAQTYPFHVVAPGLVAMAAWPPERLDAYLGMVLARPTERSVTDPAAIRGRLTAIADAGYAWTDQELDLEVNGLAAPVNRNGELLAVASLYGPAYRFAEALLPKLGADFARFVATRSEALL